MIGLGGFDGGDVKRTECVAVLDVIGNTDGDAQLRTPIVAEVEGTRARVLLPVEYRIGVLRFTSPREATLMVNNLRILDAFSPVKSGATFVSSIVARICLRMTLLLSEDSRSIRFSASSASTRC